MDRKLRGRPRSIDASRLDGSDGTGVPFGGDRVHLVVPPAGEFLRTIRLVAADAASRSGCALQEVEDFRIAIDELCHLLMTATDHHLHVTVTSFDAHVVAHGSARARPNVQVDLDEVSRLIVTSTADSFDVVARRHELEFTLLKRAASAEAARARLVPEWR